MGHYINTVCASRHARGCVSWAAGGGGGGGAELENRVMRQGERRRLGTWDRHEICLG